MRYVITPVNFSLWVHVYLNYVVLHLHMWNETPHKQVLESNRTAAKYCISLVTIGPMITKNF